MFQEFVEFWYKHRCHRAECGATNWTYHSHSLRNKPIHSPEVCKCWKCGQRYWLMSESDRDMWPADVYGSATEAMDNGPDCDDGLEHPRP